MSQNNLIKVTATLFCILLAGCGGGGGGGSTGNPAQKATTPDTTTSPSGNGTTTSIGNASNPSSPGTDGSNTAPPSSSGGGALPSPGTGSSTPATGGTGGTTGSPTPTNPSVATFAATVIQAPADGATISGAVRILVSGSNIQNVELLPATGYAPLTARGVVNGDNEGAYIDFNTALFPDGPITRRVAAFNLPPGQNGSEITAMAARTWTIQNSTASRFSAQLVSAPSTATWLGDQPDGPDSPTVRFEVSGTALRNVELVSANNESIKYGAFTISADGTQAFLDWDYRLRDSNDRIYSAFDLRVLAWNVPAGEAGNSIEVMAARRYYRRISPGCGPSCTGAAP